MGNLDKRTVLRQLGMKHDISSWHDNHFIAAVTEDRVGQGAIEANQWHVNTGHSEKSLTQLRKAISF